MSESKPRICSNCHMPQGVSGTGLVTQFVAVCRCQELPDDNRDTTNICSNCGKHIASGRIGSITQFVFRSDLCSCDRSKIQPTPTTGTTFKQPAFAGFTDSDENETELELPAGSFPIDRYKPLQKLGKGGAGAVYLCRDRLLGKRVAVKVLHQLTAEQLIAFQDEARATSKLNHPNIVKVMDFGATESGVPFMVMEYIRGISLEQLLRDNGPLIPETAIEIVSNICEALSHAHSNKIFHRDLKPSNILIAPRENGLFDVRLIDFGVAKIKETTGSVTTYQGNTLAGTPAYLCPDPVLGFSYDARSEIYTLGCVFFELLTGEPPFLGQTALETVAMHVNNKVPNLADLANIPEDSTLQRIVTRCLSKDPALRFQSARRLRLALSMLSNQQLDVSGAPKAKIGRPLRSKVALSIISGLLSIVVGIAIAQLIKAFDGWNPQSENTDREFRSVSFSYLPSATAQLDEKSKVSKVCISWYDLRDNRRDNKLTELEGNLQAEGDASIALELFNCQLDETTWINLSRFKPNSLKLILCDCTPETMRNMKLLKDLRTVTISESRAMQNMLWSTSQVTTLNMERCLLTVEDLQAVAAVPSLESINFLDCKFRDAKTSSITQLGPEHFPKQLKTLTMEQYTHGFACIYLHRRPERIKELMP
ncbi:MAG: serine/threonine protein kinase [Cyanobacteria bacterium]|nr:serine/threonine protein kinase [Cyanobacteriota bacterium]